MPVNVPHRDLEELARLGAEVFAQKVRALIRPEDDGKFVAVDVRSGAYEVDEDDFAVVRRLRQRDPTSEIWLMRAGEPTAYRIGRGR